MAASHLAPDGAELGARLGLLSSVYVGDLLAKVEVTGFLIVDTIDLDEGGVVISVSATSVIVS